MRLKILFSNPPWWQGVEWQWRIFPRWRAGVRAGSRWPFTYPTFSFPGWRQPFEYLPMPFFMTFAASYVRRETNAEVVVRDSIARRESYTSFFNYLANEKFDFVFLESAAPCWEHDRHLIEQIHLRLPDTRMVVCGPAASAETEKILRELPVVACVQGEYEKGAVDVVNGKTGVIGYNLLTVAEMNAAPWPLYDDAVATAYYDRNPRGGRRPAAQVWGSRGCPYKCIFCVWPATMTGNDPEGTQPRTVRHYTAEYLEPFLKDRIGRYGYRSVYFDDDTFNLGNAHTLELSQMMGRLGLPWAAMCRADTISMETWDVMRHCGCYGVKIGFESGSQYVVDQIVNKHLDLTQARDVVEHLKCIGIRVHGTFTVGLPGETLEQMRETLQFAESLKLHSWQISGTAEIEGTPLHGLRKSGHLDRYRGAVMDANDDRAVDGNKKWQALAEELRKH